MRFDMELPPGEDSLRDEVHRFVPADRPTEAHVSPAEVDAANDSSVGGGEPSSAPLYTADAFNRLAAKRRTVGVSPKAVWAVIAAVLAYLLTQQAVDFPAWVDLLLTVASVGGAAAIASPGLVVEQIAD